MKNIAQGFKILNKITDNITFVIITLTEIILSTRKKSITLPTCKIIHRVNQKCATIFSFVTINLPDTFAGQWNSGDEPWGVLDIDVNTFNISATSKRNLGFRFVPELLKYFLITVEIFPHEGGSQI